MANDINRSIKIYIDSTEAGKSIEGLKAKIKTLEAQLNKLDSSDPKQAEQAAKLKSSLESSYRSLDKYKTGVEQTERVLKNLSGTTYKELLAVQQRIKNDLNNTARGTAEYNMKLEQLKRVSKEVTIAQNEMRTVVGAQGSMWSRASDFVNKYMGVIGSAIAAVTGVSLAFNKLREERNKLEESQADVKALTGLDDESINWLTQQAKELSTTAQESGIRIRKSADEIMEAYMLVGSAKPELLGDKEALAEVTKQTMILAEASGMQLKDAVDAVTLALNQYGMGADKAAEFVNTLAAGSKFGASAVESQTAAILKAGVAASSANVNFQQLVGVIETLGEKGIKDEIAGTGLKKFFLTLQTGADETNPKIVGLQTALENLSKKQLTATEIKKQFGEEGYNVAQVLISEADKVKYYTEAVTGTSVAMEQAGIKGQTAQAKLEQAKNKMTELGVELMEQLNPAITATINKTVNWTKRVVEAAEWAAKHTGLLITLGIEIASYTLLVKTLTNWEAIRNGQMLTSITTSKAYLVVTTTLKGAQIALAGVQALLTGNLVRARAAWALLNSTMLLNPAVAIGVAITALTIGIYKLATRTTEAKEAMKDFTSQSIKEQTELTKLYDALKNAAVGTKQRSDLIKEFNEKYGQYLPKLLTEKSTLNDIRVAYDNVTSAMRRNIAQKILNQKTDKIMNDSLEDQQSELDDVRKQLSDNLPESQVSKALSDVVVKTELLNAKGYDLKTTWTSVFQYLYKQYYGSDIKKVPAHLANQLKDYVKEVYKAAGQVAAVKNELNPFLQDNSPKSSTSGEAQVYAEATITAPSTPKAASSVEGKSNAKSAADLEKEEQEKRLKVVNDAIMKEKEALQQKYIDGAIMYDDYQKELEMLTLKQLSKQLAVYGVDSDKRKQIEQQIYEFKQKLIDEDFNDYVKALDAQGEKDRQAKELKEKNAKELNDQLQIYVKQMNENLKKGTDSSMGKISSLALKYQNNILDFAQSLGETLGTTMTDTEATLTDALGDILLLALDTLRQIVTMSIAQATIQNIAKYGIKGLIKAAVEIAAINAAYYAVKGLIKKPSVTSSSSDTSSESATKTGYRSATTDTGYAVGGYTGAGGMLEPAGIVHRNEYVVPAWEMAQPVAMNHVAALEAIRQQRSNQVRANGYANGGQVGDSASLASMSSEALITAITKLSDKIDTMRAYVVLSDLEAKQSLRNKARSIGSK